MADHMDLVRLQALSAYWDENPPIHLMVKAYLGIERKPRRDVAAPAPSEEMTTAILSQSAAGANPQAMNADTLARMFADRAKRLNPEGPSDV